MYRCTVNVHFAGCPANIAEAIHSVPVPENFSVHFSESQELDTGLASRADVIIFGPGIPNKAIEALGHGSSPPEIILLRHVSDASPDRLPASVSDIWKLPMSDAELRFHFDRWLQTRKLAMDLGEKNQFLECLMNTSPNLIWFKDKNGSHELVNESFCRTVNKSRAEVQGRNHASIWNVEEDDPACIESERIVMESGEVHTSEEEITTGDGKRLLITYKAPLRDSDDSMMGTMGIAVDVTLERRYREKLAQNNAALETLFTTMDCGVLCHTLDGSHIISINNAALTLLGYRSKKELEADFQMVAGTVYDSDKPRLRAAIGQLRNVGDSASYEYKVKHGENGFLHVMGNARLVEKDGQVVCQRFLLDCTAQKLAEQKELIERERKQKELVRALSIDFQLVFVFEENGGAILQLLDYPDQRLKDIFDGALPLEEKIGQYIESCVHPDDREACRKEFSRDSLISSLLENEIHYYNYRAFHNDEIHYFQLKAVRAGDQTDSFGIVVGLQSMDSQTRKEMEHKAALGEALKQARRASAAKSIFLSNMSHDIRTPMNAVLGYTTLALNHLENPLTATAYLKKIQDSGNHLISLINDILDMSHIESGKIQLDENVWRLTDLLRELWNIVQPSADARAQTLKLEINDLVNDDVYCDKLRLKQVLLNLLSNAVKYTGRGGKIRMSLTQLPSCLPGRAAYEIRLRDNGIGMSEDFLEHIFEPFERAQSPAIAGIQGTGLGMAIARNIVELMKGDISVESEPGAGTEFTVRLAFRLPRASECAQEETPDTGENAGPRRGTILLTEDNEMNQEIASEFLSGAGYTVEIANNGQEAVNMLKSAGPGHYDVILMDVQMPVMDGYTATSRIRALPDREVANIPIIAMTANSFEEDRMEALKRGMNGHVAKPIDFNALFRTLDRFMTK